MSRRDLFLDNSYALLGLEAGAPVAAVMRRASEIEKMLKIDMTSTYDADYDFIEERRTPARIDASVRRLNNAEKRVEDSYFCYAFHSAIDERAFKRAKNGEYDEAIEVLASRPNDKISLRNKAIIESIAFSRTKLKKWLRASLSDWKQLLDSQSAWDSFFAFYTLNDSDIDESILEKFKKHAKDILLSYYDSIASEKNDISIINEANTKLIGDHSSGTSSGMYRTKLETIDELNKELESTADNMRKAIDNEATLSTSRVKQIRALYERANAEYGAIQSNSDHLWSSAEMKRRRTAAARELNNIANLLFKYEHSENSWNGVYAAMRNLSELAYNIAPEGSDIESTVKENFDSIKNNKDVVLYKEQMNEILALMRSGGFQDAYDKVCLLLEAPYVSDRMRAKLIDLKNTLESHGYRNRYNKTSISTSTNSNDGSVAGVVIFLIIIFIIAIIAVSGS